MVILSKEQRRENAERAERARAAVPTCAECQGDGSICSEILDIEGDWPGGVIPSYEWCPSCDGGQHRNAALCPECNGTRRTCRGQLCTHCLNLGRMTPAVLRWRENADKAYAEWMAAARGGDGPGDQDQEGGGA